MGEEKKRKSGRGKGNLKRGSLDLGPIGDTAPNHLQVDPASTPTQARCVGDTLHSQARTNEGYFKGRGAVFTRYAWFFVSSAHQEELSLGVMHTHA